MRALESQPLKTDRRVVVVDGLPETETVLRAVLEPQGIAVSHCRRNRLADFEEVQSPPQLLVVHDESPSPPESLAAEHSRWSNVPRVFVGSLNSPTNQRRGDSVLSQPFQYGDLIRAIERWLPNTAADGRAA